MAGTVRSLYQQDSTGNVSRGGTYNGYFGTFTCPSGCNMAAGADNALTGVTGTWTFTASPTAGGTTMQDPRLPVLWHLGFAAECPHGGARLQMDCGRCRYH